MNDIIFMQLYDKVGLYEEKNGKCKLAVFSDTELSPSITLEQAVQNSEVSFVYSEEPAPSADAAKTMLQTCKDALQKQKTKRGLLWLSSASAVVLSLADDLTMIRDVFLAPVDGTAENGIDVKLSYGAKLKLQADGSLRFRDNADFSFGELQLSMRLFRVVLMLCGEDAGTLQVEMAISGDVFDNIFKCGLEYGFTDADGQTRLISNRLFDQSSIKKTDFTVRFTFGFGALSGNRMRFLSSQSPLLLGSNFRTLYGDVVYLTPVTDDADGGGISFLPRISENVCSAPLGQYRISTRQAGDIILLCGFSGTELLQISQNSKIFFVPNQPAFSPFFPEREFSISDFVEPPAQSLLTDSMVTSWVVFSGGYASQPLEAPFFSGANNILTLTNLQTDFKNGSPAVPLMPYYNIKHYDETSHRIDCNRADCQQISGFERVVLANERSNRLHNVAVQQQHLRCVTTHPPGDLQPRGNAVTTAATPSGFIGTVKGGQFQQISLAFSPLGAIAFDDVTEEVCAAFFSASMFCVFANADHLGKFQNLFSIEDWQFSLCPGAGSSYNQYANIILVKGVKGKIYDPENTSAGLCCNIGQWTCKEYFSKPAEGEYANLSSWLLNYCKAACARSADGDRYYDNFVQIITDETWRGVLALNVSLQAADFPPCLQALLLGVPDTSTLCAHHIGAEIISLRPTANGPVNSGYSAFFGYMHYEAAGYCGTVMPIQNPSAVYEFKLLELNVQFEKNRVQEFNSASQFVLGEFLSQKPSVGGCLYNALLLKGALQSANGHSVLMLRSDGGNLVFSQSPLANVSISGITMVTIRAEEKEYAFDIMGQMSFQKADGIDVFSYENLQFSGYQIHLNGDIFSLDLSAMRFDLSLSKARDGSLCKIFGLTPFTVYSTIDKITAFTKMAVEGFKNSSLSAPACGMAFSVCLGGLGALSAGSDLTAKILLAWDQNGRQFAGIQLPGQTMIQNVIGLTVGDVRVSRKDGSLVLYLSKIALELLGLLKLPTSGALQLALTGTDQGIGWYAAYEQNRK